MVGPQQRPSSSAVAARGAACATTESAPPCAKRPLTLTLMQRLVPVDNQAEDQRVEPATAAPEKQRAPLPLGLAAADAIHQLSSESLQLVLSFLAPTDRLPLLVADRTLAREPLATSYASFCGRCAQCALQSTHLCDAPATEARDASFWTCLLRRSGHHGLRALRVAACDAFSAQTLLTVDAATRATAFASLSVLDLNRCTSLGPDGLRLLAEQCCSLRELRIRDMAVDAAALALLLSKNHATLRVVDFEGCHTLMGVDARHLVKCQRLEELSLAGCYNVDNGAVAEVVRACSTLTSLNLRFCHKVDDVLVETIALALPKLRSLNLRYCMKVTDRSVGVVCERLPNLQSLDLSHCSKITDAAVAGIVDSLRSLQDLRLWACSKLTSASVEAIALASPSLERVDIRSRNPTEAVIGGRDGVQMLVCKRSHASLMNHEGGGGGGWEPAEDEPGVFKRQPTCAVAVAA
jgi:hypothetical protein